MTKRSDSIVRRMAPVSASIWWILRARYSPTQSVPSAQVRPESRPWAGAGMVATTWPERGSTFWIRSSASCHRYLPSKAVPASAATASSRTSAPLFGIERDDALAAGEPDVRAVEGHAVDLVHAGIGAVFAEDLRLLGLALACRCHDPRLPTASAPGSNKVVANPPSAGASQRRERPRPTARTAAASSSWRNARWTVRWLEPSARASADVDHDSPPSSRARIEPAGPSIGGASTTTARRVDRGEREAAPGRLDAGKRAQSGAQAAELDAEPGPVRLVGGARLEGALDEAIARDVGRPGLGEGADQSEQDRASGERDTASRTANRAPAGIDDEVAGGEQGLDFIEADRANHAGADEARRRRRQGASGPADLGDQGRDAGGDGGGVSAVERDRGVRDPDAAERELGAGELGPGRERRRHGGGGTSTAASVCSAASSSPTRSWRRAPTRRAWSALARSPSASSACAAASSMCTGRVRSRAASATSASATWQRAWARRSRAPKPRAARRRSLRARS